MLRNSKINNKYKLSAAIRIVDGVKSWCVMNLHRGECILINHSAAEILMAFSENATFEEVFDAINIPEAHQKDVICFLEQCVNSDILLNPTLLKDSQNSPQKRSRHISASTLSLVLELSTKCNLSCQHCYNNSGIRNDDELSLSDIRKIFSDIRSTNIVLKTLTLTGGEPFLYRNLVEVLSMAHNYGFPSIRINTNGTILPDVSLRKIDHSLLKIISIQVTLLGANEKTHDTMSRSKGSFRRTVENITKFKYIGFNVGVSFIRSKYSEHEFEEALKLGEKLGIEVTPGDLFPLGRAAENFSKLELNSTEREMYVACDSKYYDGKEAGILSEDKRLSLLEGFPPDLACGKNTIAISSNGDVIPCMLLQGIVVGNIAKQSLPEIMESASLSDFRKKTAIENRQICSKCELRYACSNKCPAVSLAYSGDITQKNPFCSYY